MEDDTKREILSKKRRRDDFDHETRESIEEGLLETIDEIECEVSLEKQQMLEAAVSLMESQHRDYINQLDGQRREIEELKDLIAQYRIAPTQASAILQSKENCVEIEQMKQELAVLRAEKNSMVFLM